MSILSLARADWENFSQSAFDLDIIFRVSYETGAETATIKGLFAETSRTIDTDGQDAIADIARLTFSENLLKTTNPAYPIRNADGLVAINQHKITVTNSAGIVLDLTIKNVYPDSTVGMITCDLAMSKTHPIAPSDMVVSDIMATSFTGTITSNSSGVESGFSWEISTDNFVNDIVIAGTTAKNVVTFDYTGLISATTYQVRAKATGGVDSEYTDIVTAITI